MKIKLAIADDHALFRKGIVNILQQVPDFEFVIQASNGQELLDMLALLPIENYPEVVLMDLQMPVMDGMKATEMMKADYPEIKIIALSMHDEDHFVSHLMEIGANGYLLKDSDPEEVETAIYTVVKEEFYYGAFLNKVMHRRMLNKNGIKSVSSFGHIHKNTKLTERELEILRYICEGFTNTEIGEKIFLSPRTVDGHRTRIMDKVGVKNTAGLVVYAIKNNFV